MIGFFSFMGIAGALLKNVLVLDGGLAINGVRHHLPYSGGIMNASLVTHGLKLIGGNTRMWVGVAVIALLAFALGCWIDQKHQQRGFDSPLGAQ
jgi:hypothetical protein